MAQKIKVRLIRPLNGQDVGKVVSYEKADADRLAATGAVEILGKEKAPRPPKSRAKKAPAPANKKAPAPKNKGA